MNIGFKTGPRTWEEGKKIVTEDGAKMCEIWFRTDKAESYNDMLAWLKEQRVHIALHHWGVVEGKYKTNIASDNPVIRNGFIEQMKKTIDIGTTIECAYVNIHPGAQCTEISHLDTGGQEIVDVECTDRETARKHFLESAEELNEYAKGRDVLLTIETLPKAEPYSGEDRSRVYNPESIDLDIMKELGGLGIAMANDTTHTLGQFALEDGATKESMFSGFMDFTKETAENTRLLHINTTVPPYNGTDSHDGVVDSDFENGVFPNKEQMIEFLSVFAGRDDVYALCEPPDKTAQANYRALTGLVEGI